MSARDRLIASLVEESLGKAKTPAADMELAAARYTDHWTILVDCLARHVPDVDAWLHETKHDQTWRPEPGGDYVRFRRGAS